MAAPTQDKGRRIASVGLAIAGGIYFVAGSVGLFLISLIPPTRPDDPFKQPTGLAWYEERALVGSTIMMVPGAPWTLGMSRCQATPPDLLTFGRCATKLGTAGSFGNALILWLAALLVRPPKPKS